MASSPSSTKGPDRNVRFTYRIYGALLSSHVPLPELPKSRTGSPRFRFLAANGRSRWPEPDAWVHTWRTPGGGEAMRAAKVRGGYLVRFPRLAEFLIRDNGRRIEGRLIKGSAPGVLRQLLIDHVLPHALSLQGRLVLHAGAVAMRGRAVVFLGETGSGKSTLCASFKRAGFGLLTDDGLLLKRKGSRWYGVPGYGGLKLWRDSFRNVFGARPPYRHIADYRSKNRITLSIARGRRARRWPIQRMYCIVSPRARSARAVRIEVPATHEALLALLRQTFRLDPSRQDLARNEFKELGRLAARKIVRILTYPRAYAWLPRVRKAVAGDLSKRDANRS